MKPLASTSCVLVALALAACDSTIPNAHTWAARRPRLEAERCEVVPPFVPNFEPELEWQWTGGAVLPEYRQVMMTPIVVDVSGDGVPDVVFNAFKGANYHTDGVLRALSGADGTDLWAVTDPRYRVRGAASLAAADLDGDGRVELCTVPQYGDGLICFEHDGAFKFRTSLPFNNWGGVSFADLEGDGSVEILDGNHVFSATGVLKWVGSDGMGGQQPGPLSFAADLDGDGTQEVINGRALYRHDGTLKCRNTDIGQGLAGVANFDEHPAGEVVVVWSGRVSLMDQDCVLKWTASIPGGGSGGPPNIADFNNDGVPEVGVAGARRYVVFDRHGAILWTQGTQDLSSNVTGSSTFDFEGDGRAEVVYADERHLRIYDGATGAVRFQVAHGSGTTYENPVIVDVDADDNAEIVLASNDYAFPGFAGIRVYRDRRDGWVNTRRLWNQHAYSVTNIHDDGTVPAHPERHWLTPGLNMFRSNSQGSGTTSPFAAPDLGVSGLSASCDRETGTLRLTASVGNRGDAAASAGLRVAFYAGNPASGGTLLGVDTLPSVLAVGDSATVSLSLHPAPGGGVTEVYAVADDDGTGQGRESECDEANNAVHAPLDLTCLMNQPPVALCRDVTVSADASCQGSASIDAGSHDPDGQPSPLTLTQAPAGPWGLGSHLVTLTAFDGLESATCTGTLTVVDTTPPVPGESRGLTLWPPNHRLVTVSLEDCAAPARDACGGTLPPGTHGLITHVTSDEPEDARGNGDGRTCGDVRWAGPTSVRLRAEREGTSDGRVYTVHYVVTDASGNAAPGACRVGVPHDASGRPAVEGAPRSCVGSGCPEGPAGSPPCQ